jgi:RNA polymerase sigma-70 factor (ECF subfamily)
MLEAHSETSWTEDVPSSTQNVTDMDLHLLQLVRQGVPGAFESLVEPYKGRLFQAILRITKQREDAEDALQEALFRAYSKIDQFEGNSRFSTWLFSIGINQARMFLRTKRYRPSTSLEEMAQGENGFIFLDLPETRPTPEEEYVNSELGELLSNAIGKLPQSLRTAFVMCHVQELGQSKAAATLGISVNALKSRSFRARRYLQDHLSKQRPGRGQAALLGISGQRIAS